MAITPVIRTRSTLVAGAAVLVVVTATGSVSAHEGGAAEGTVHACVNTATGALRVLADAAQQCRASETPIHWTIGNGSSEDLAAFRAELAAAGGAGALVHWSNLAGVPDGLEDGVDHQDLGPLPAGSVGSSAVADESLTAADLAEGSVGSAEIAAGAVQNEDLAAGAVTGGTIGDGTVTAADLAGSYGVPPVPGAVTGEKIADGTIEPRDLRPEVATSASTGTAVLTADGSDIGTAVVHAAAGSAVTVTGQAQLRLAGSCSPCAAVVSYRLLRDGTPLGPLYQVDLSDAHAQDVVSVSLVDTVTGGGAHAYALRLSADGTAVSAGALVLNAQVLGAR